MYQKVDLTAAYLDIVYLSSTTFTLYKTLMLRISIKTKLNLFNQKIGQNAVTNRRVDKHASKY